MIVAFIFFSWVRVTYLFDFSTLFLMNLFSIPYFPQIWGGFNFRAFNFRAFNFRAPWEKRVLRDFNFRAVDRKYNFVQKIYGETNLKQWNKMATICVVLQSGLKSWVNMVTNTLSLYKRVPRQKMCTPWKKRISRVLIFAHPSCAKIVSLIFAHLFCAKINVTRNLGKVRYTNPNQIKHS